MQKYHLLNWRQELRISGVDGTRKGRAAEIWCVRAGASGGSTFALFPWEEGPCFFHVDSFRQPLSRVGCIDVPLNPKW